MKKILILIIISMIIVTGCTNGQLQQNNEEPLAITTQGSDNEIIERSEMISDSVVELYGIDDATSIILNDSVLIGVKIAYDEKLTNETREAIESAVKTVDDGISEIIITDKARQFSEIDSIVTELLQGQSYESNIKQIDNLKNKMK